MTSKSATLLNHPNYYWNQSVQSFDEFSDSHFHNHRHETELYMWLFLFAMSTIGD